uniref:peptidylprolyl isomerase n=1 Tax=Rhipicephalus pulchellus TaxID=72859 RepID=L7LXR6_RHIPC
MFWGVTLESGKRYSQVVDTSYHLSMAALEPKSGGEPVMVMLEHGKAEFLLCTLDQAHARQVALDLNFVEGEEVCFFLNGKGTVHLTGYLTDGLQDDAASSDDEEEDEEVSLQDEEEADEDNELALAPTKPIKFSKKLKKSLLQAANGDSEDDSDFDVNKVEDGTEDDDDEDEEESDEEEPEPTPALPQKRPAKRRHLVKPMSNASSSKEQGPSSTPAAEPHDGTPKKKRKKTKQQSEGAAAVSGSPKIQQSPQGGAAGEKGTMLPGGVISTDLRLGNGPVAKPGKNVHVYYTGRLANSHVFDKCVSGKAFSFRLGKHEVIKGWETGIEGKQHTLRFVQGCYK